MNVKGLTYHLVSNGSGQFVAAVSNTTDSDGNLVIVKFAPISIVDSDKVYQAIATTDLEPTATTDEAPPQKPRPPGEGNPDE